MIGRRTVLNGTALGGALAALTPQPALEASSIEAVQQGSDRVVIDVSSITQSIKALHDEVRRQETFWEIDSVRDQIKTFLRLSGKFPGFIEVGTDVWHQVYDWHVRYRQPLTIAKNADDRYTILLMSTLVIMRTELAASYIGQAYDNR